MNTVEHQTIIPGDGAASSDAGFEGSVRAGEGARRPLGAVAEGGVVVPDGCVGRAADAGTVNLGLVAASTSVIHH